MASALQSLKVPVDWPSNPSIIGGGGGIKIAEGLAVCGDRGMWTIGQLDIGAECREVLIGILSAAATFLKKRLPEPELTAAHEALVDALALGEAVLPLQWATITTHMLLHSALKIGDWGAFWAINMLMMERLHVLLKRMASGSRDRMQSFANHYDLWDAAQTTWRFTGDWITPPKKSTMAGFVPMKEHDTVTEPKGARRTIKLNETVFDQVMELWATENRPLSALLARFAKEKTILLRRPNSPVIELKDFAPKKGPRLTGQEKEWLQTSKYVKAIGKATLDGVMFRTQGAQAKFRSDNSCVAEEYKERDEASAVHKNYGIIKSMFLHSLPGGAEEIIVDCDWYKEAGINPRTHLRQVSRNVNFDRCRVAFLKNLYPHNLVLWPSDCNNADNGLLDVIEHHE